MKVRMNNSKIWKNFIGAISNLIDKAAFTFTPEGVKMKAMDPSHVAMVDFELSAAGFDEYDVEEKKILGTDLVEMSKILSRARKDDEFILDLEEDESRLALIFKGVSTRKITLPLIDVEEGEIPEPDLNFTGSAKVLVGVIRDGLKDASLVTDNLRFEVSEECFLMTSEGDVGSAELKLSKGDEGLRELKVEEPGRAVFSIGYLKDITKAARSNDVVNIYLGSDLPIQMDFPIAKGKGRLRFLLAPRIETE